MASRNAGKVAKIQKRDDFRGHYPHYVNEDVAYHLGRALMATVFGGSVSDGGEKRQVAVGWDARLSSPALAQALAQGLSEDGAHVRTLGLCSSEMLYFAAGSEPNMAGGVMITASHNPKDENGFKIVKKGAESISGEELNAIAAETTRLLALPVGCGEPLSIAEAYAERVIDESGIRRQWDGGRLRIVVEAGNGVGAMAFREVARKLPYLDVVYSNARPNGEYPVCVPNPVKPSYMGIVREHVLDNAADVGLAFDGDGDRVGAVDSHGAIITPSEVMAIIVDRLLSGDRPDAEIMYNLTCSRLVHDRILAHQATALVTPVGHGQIKPVLREHFTNAYFQSCGRRCLFAGEHSGHYFFPDFFFADSGMIAGLMIVERVIAFREQGQDLHETISGWRERYFAVPETNFDMRIPDPQIPEDRQQELLDECVRKVRKRGEELGGQVRTDYDAAPQSTGTKIGLPTLKMEFGGPELEWWFCVRPSGNEPLLRLNAEVVLSQMGVSAGVDGSKALGEKFDDLVQVIGPQYLEK